MMVHDYVFSTVGFAHAFSKDADILANSAGPKFSEVVLTGDTAMFKTPFLCALRTIVHEGGFPRVCVAPLCAKHGPNECDGAGSRVKRIADHMVITKTFDEKHPASFCAIVMDGAPTLRAIPMYNCIASQKGWVDSMMPGGSVDNLVPLKRGFGEMLLTDTEPFSLYCRTDVLVHEPWRLEESLGYPLPLNMNAPTWMFLDMASNPKTQCLPCSALTGKKVDKGDHDQCLFAAYTRYSQCSRCGKREGHNKRNCPTVTGVEPPVTTERLRGMCLRLGLSGFGTKAVLQRRLDQHNDMPALELVDDIRVDGVVEVDESEDELSEEVNDDF